MPQETGSSLMELEFHVMVLTGISTGPEVTWQYICTAKEVEWKGSTAVRYQIQQILCRPYTLECIYQNLVSMKLLFHYIRCSILSLYQITILKHVWSSLFDGYVVINCNLRSAKFVTSSRKFALWQQAFLAVQLNLDELSH